MLEAIRDVGGTDEVEVSCNVNLEEESQGGTCVEPQAGMEQSPVSPNLGFRIRRNILKNLTNGMPDRM